MTTSEMLGIWPMFQLSTKWQEDIKKWIFCSQMESRNLDIEALQSDMKALKAKVQKVTWWLYCIQVGWLGDHRTRYPVLSHFLYRLVANVHKTMILLHLLLWCWEHDICFSFLRNDKRTLKWILCSQMQNVKVDSDMLTAMLKNMQVQVEKVSIQCVVIHQS
jgi:hypothetical protein